jgi:predicted TIM-barrel fold metal-dependent hydrolase
MVAELSPSGGTITAERLIALLDSAGIRGALVLSVAYQFGNPNRPPVANEYEKVKAENDWTSSEIARFPDRLRGFCSFNPLRTYALEEVHRCAKDSHIHFGIKLHFGNSDVNLDDPEQVETLRAVFGSANDCRMAIAVHLRPSVTMRRLYGAAQSRVFLTKVLAAAPDVPVQIAHLAGAGGYDSATDEAFSVFVDAVARKDPLVSNVYFDVSGVVGIGAWTADQADKVVMRIRQLGLSRVLYGSDAAVATNSPREAWEKFKTLPLSESEFSTINNNVAPYMRPTASARAIGSCSGT